MALTTLDLLPIGVRMIQVVSHRFALRSGLARGCEWQGPHPLLQPARRLESGFHIVIPLALRARYVANVSAVIFPTARLVGAPRGDHDVACKTEERDLQLP